MPYGKIYDTSNFGNPVENGWGGVYYDLTEFEILDHAQLILDSYATVKDKSIRPNLSSNLSTISTS